ncbi:MAG: DUF2807 domain-containing protein [Prevotella sp.]|nr:DUF2807 domain-containing protein [Prevotella sp.]
MKKIFSNAIIINIAICMIGLTSCIRKKPDYGKEVTRTVKVSEFQQIKLDGNAIVHIAQGNKYGVTIKVKEKLLPYIKVTEKDGVLTVFQDDVPMQQASGAIHINDLGTNNGTVANVYITVKNIKSLVQQGNASIDIAEPMSLDSLYMGIGGNSSIDINQLTVKGLNVVILGNASVDFNSLTADKAAFGISGNADMDVIFKNTGAAIVKVLGNASISLSGTTQKEIEQHVTGNASITDNTTRTK